MTCPDHSRHPVPSPAAAEGGFAIPMTILLITIISVMLSAGFARVRADRQVAEGAEVSAEAVAVARSGLSQFIANQATRPPDNFVDTMYVTGGYAIINARVLQNPADTFRVQSWVLRSTGYVIDPNTGSTPRAQRTVAQMAQWQAGYVKPRGALIAANDVEIHRYGGVYISGTDFGGCWTATPPGMRTTTWSNNSNSQLYLYGSPTVVTHGSSSGQRVADSMDIDWAGIVAGNFEPDHTTFAERWDWSVTYIDGNLAITSNTGVTGGSGVLIVKGDLHIRTTFMFMGLVIVGGEIESSPPPAEYVYLRGLTVTGMNKQLGQTTSDTDIAMDDSYYYDGWTYLLYDSCMLQNALQSFNGFMPLENAWIDNWATY